MILRKGSREGTLRAEATPAKMLEVLVCTGLSELSMFGRLVAIMVLRPAALVRLEVISRLSVHVDRGNGVPLDRGCGMGVTLPPLSAPRILLIPLSSLPPSPIHTHPLLRHLLV